MTCSLFMRVWLLGLTSAVLTPIALLAQPLPLCSDTSTSLCEIRYDETITGLPASIAVFHMGAQIQPDGTVLVPRTAIVWPGDGSLASPPLMVFAGGHGSEALGNATTMQFETLWPEAVIVYLQASRLVDHDGEWRDPSDPQFGDTDWAPRFPANEATGDHSDLPYLDRVLSEVDTLFGYDPKKTYAAGHSSGGFFTFSLNGMRRDVFAAFAVVGAYARYGDTDDVIAAGEVPPARPILLMLGDKENVFEWRPAIPGPSGGTSHARRSVMQLQALNGLNVPTAAKVDADLQELVDDLRAAAPADRYKELVYGTGKRRVVLAAYGGDHSVPPRDADDPSLSGAEWIVRFFRTYADGVPLTAELVDRTDMSRGVEYIPRVDVPRRRICQLMCTGCPVVCQDE